MDIEENDIFLSSLTDSNFKKELIATTLNDLIELGTTITLESGETLLKAGDQNKDLYFLLSGVLNVLVQNEKVAILKEKGDIVGEMSIVSKSVCKADVIAESKSSILKVPLSELQHDDFEKNLKLYKILCLTLSEKLEKTNVKAKDFELLNKSLEEKVIQRTNDLKLKNDSLTIGLSKLEEMFKEGQALLDKVVSIKEQYVDQALKILESQKVKSAIDKSIYKNLVEMEEELCKFATRRSNQEALNEKNVLIIEENAKQRNMMKMALVGTGIKVDAAKSTVEAETLFFENDYSIIFLSTDSLSFAKTLEKEDSLKTEVVLVTDGESKDYIQNMTKYPFLTNIIARREEDRAFNIRSITTTLNKMITKDIFGLDKYLNWGVEIKTFSINSSVQRREVNDQVVEYLTNLGLRSSVKTKASSVLEEMLMNAIYDAPVDEKGDTLYNNLSRTVEVNLSTEQAPTIKVATDGLFLALSVADPFGAFKKETIFKYLENNYYNLNENMNKELGKGGAGKGLYMITEQSDLVIYNVKKGSRTEVIALFDLSPNRSSSTPSVHYFEG